MNKKNLYIALVAVLVVAAFFVGGMVDFTAAPQQQPVAEQETPTEPTPEPETPEQPAQQPDRPGVINIYTSRHYGVEPVFDRFTEETGIEIRFTTGSDALLRERLKAEGANTPADMYIAVDAGNLWLAAQDGLLAALDSETLLNNIPENLRDPEGRWFGLTKRVRTLMFHPDRVTPDELSTYEDLADPRWKGRIAMRPSTHSYTQSLVSSLIAAHGVERAEEIVRGWAQNEPVYIDSDTQLLEALAAGEADVAITNHYYLGRILQDNPDFPIQIFWANQDDRGAHVNVSGAGVTTYGPNRENAIKLLEWLSGDGQEMFASTNHEFPANPNVPAHPIIVEFGEYMADPLAKSEFGRLQADAVELLHRAGYQ